MRYLQFTSKNRCIYLRLRGRHLAQNARELMAPRVNLVEYNGYFTGNFKCGTHANLLATSMQNFLLLQAKTLESQVKIRTERREKIPAIANNEHSNFLELFLSRLGNKKSWYVTFPIY